MFEAGALGCTFWDMGAGGVQCTAAQGVHRTRAAEQAGGRDPARSLQGAFPHSADPGGLCI